MKKRIILSSLVLLMLVSISILMSACGGGSMSPNGAASNSGSDSKESDNNSSQSESSEEAEEATSDGESIRDYDYLGVYSGEKYIDAMGCDIRIRLSLKNDGTFDYYRYPMVVALQGAGAMPDLVDKGSYEITDDGFKLTAEVLGEYQMGFMIDTDGIPYVSGQMPTGGAPTTMKLVKNDTEDRGESGTYKGSGETADGVGVEYELVLNKGEYEFKGSTNGSEMQVFSRGTYSFDGSRIEFAASEGVSFGATFDSERGVVEGTTIPTNGEDASENTAVTLAKVQ